MSSDSFWKNSSHYYGRQPLQLGPGPFRQGLMMIGQTTIMIPGKPRSGCSSYTLC